MQIVERVSPAPAMGNLPAMEQEHRHRVKGTMPPGRSPAQEMGQERTQAAEVDQAQDQVKVRKMFPCTGIEDVWLWLVGIMGTVGSLGRRRDIRCGRPTEWQAVLQAPQAAFTDKLTVSAPGLNWSQISQHGGLPGVVTKIEPVYLNPGNRIHGDDPP